MAIPAQEVKRVKGQGFLRNRGTDNFSGRIITENGVLTAEQMKTISDAALKFGNGNVTFTSRLTVEVPGIPFDKIEEFQNFIAPSGLETGGTGPKIRPIVSCKGTTCVFGLYDTQAVAAELHRRFYIGYRDILLPHKFKIAVGGCPNNCVKPDLNDLGIIGQRVPKINADHCRSCKKCGVVAECPMKAATLENTIHINEKICNHCGRCLSKCPFGSIEETEVKFRVTIGGRWGKHCRIGTPLSKLLSYDEMLNTVEKAILLFKIHGQPGERFGATVDRLGMEIIEAMLFSDELLTQKSKVFSTVAEGGSLC